MRRSYACDPDRSRGRLFAERESALRTAFQRDRDRIIHCSAFRRLKHKTQVFVEHEGDHYRTRLTHSLEVAQVARTIAGVLGLDVDLTEAVALAHDLGHPPFGHTGEDALDQLMAPHGGFDHNAQAVRIVTSLERHYAEFDGLNLTWETLEGMAKHNGPLCGPNAVRRGRPDPGRPTPETRPQDLHYALADYTARHDLHLDGFASAEAQVAALADDIAYNSHDLHDGLRAGLFGLEDLARLPLLDQCFAQVDTAYPGLEDFRRRHEVLRRFFGLMVEDVVAQARARLAALEPSSPDDIRAAGHEVVRFSDPVWADLRVIREFLFHRMYRAPQVVEMRRRMAQVLMELFPRLMERPDLMPRPWQKDVAALRGETQLARLVADYIAGMTDRFALQTHARLMGGACH